jgi:hypothetical protein
LEWSRADAHADVGAFTFRNTTVHTEREALAPVTLQLQVHLVLVLRPSCIPEKVGVNKKGLNEKYSHEI